MDKDSIIASVLDIYSDECTLKNDMGDVLRIKTNDENIKKILHNLFYDVLNIEFNLWAWIRGMNKYGDYFLHLDIEEGVGIVNVSPLSPSVTPVPDRGLILFTFTSLIKLLLMSLLLLLFQVL